MEKPSSPSAFTDADERILRYLREVSTDYPALVAGNTGLHVSLVERRIALLEAEGYVEAVTGEAVYRATDAADEALETLDARPSASGVDPGASAGTSDGTDRPAVPDGGDGPDEDRPADAE